MSKVSAYGVDLAPLATDYLFGDQASGPTTSRYRVSDIVNTDLLTMPVKFSAYLAAGITSVTSGFALLNYDNEAWDTGNNFSTSTGLFTAPYPGYYRFSVAFHLVAAAASHTIGLALNSSTAEKWRLDEDNNPGNNNITLGNSRTVHLNANDTIGMLYYSTEAKAITGNAGLNWFQGELIATT